MPTLELLIDGTKIPGEAAKISRELDGIRAAADRAVEALAKAGRPTGILDANGNVIRRFTEEVKEAGRSLNSAFQVTGGGVQIATGITQTAKAFGELNTAAGLFNASRTLLEIGNTSRDFGQLRSAVGGAATVFGTLGAVIRANPIGAVATAIGIAATAFAAFSSGAKQAVVDYRALAEEIRKNSIFAEADRILGIPADPSKQLDQRLQAIRQLTQGIIAGQGLPGGFNQLRESAGLTNEQLIAALAFEGNQSASQLLSGGAFTVSGGTSGGGQLGSLGPITSNNPSQIRLTNQQALAVLRSYSQSILQQGGQVATPSVDFGFGSGEATSTLVSRPGFDSLGRREGTRFGPFGVQGFGDDPGSGVLAIDQQERALQVYYEMLEKQTAQLERAAAAGEQFGQAIGGALFDAISGANTLRGALASVFQSLARQGFQSGIGGIFGAVVKGITGAQAAQNTGVDPAPLAPNE